MSEGRGEDGDDKRGRRVSREEQRARAGERGLSGCGELGREAAQVGREWGRKREEVGRRGWGFGLLGWAENWFSYFRVFLSLFFFKPT